METNNILSSDLLDIIFDGRNKEYGAYELRKSYNGRLVRATMITGGLLSLLVTGYIFANKFSIDHPVATIDAVVNLADLPVVEPKPEVIIPPKAQEPPKVKTVNSTVPIITKDELVHEDQAPPENALLEDARIGTINVDGDKDDGIKAPMVVEDRRGIIAAPKPDEADRDLPFTRVEIESIYPGGVTAWMRYLNRTFHYPTEAAENGLQGTVTVQFIVDTEGNVSNVEAISGPDSGGLRDEAVRVIKKSGRWEPAIQNGRKVKSYKKQPITFKLETE